MCYKVFCLPWMMDMKLLVLLVACDGSKPIATVILVTQYATIGRQWMLHRGITIPPTLSSSSLRSREFIKPNICVARAYFFLLLIIPSIPRFVHSMFETINSHSWHQQMAIVKECRVWSGGGAFRSNHHYHYFRLQVSYQVSKVVVIAFDPS